MPFIGLLLGFLNPSKLIDLAGTIVRFFSTPFGMIVGALAAVFIAYTVGHWRGENAAEAICAQEKIESVAQAARMDAGVSQSSFRDLQERVAASDERALAAQTQITEERFRASQLSSELQACRRLTDQEWDRVKP